ncbi:uncharacterized protein LOC133192991 [Saccostrea echinata]|uniref:uncharacterized protein LOC133192991 n=1 Tax=Saccostrea echinata TaxID=191078 RepID=UPI002A80C5D5|nr:uncharacterized protein LOC133192991 [Saccostrea echinata]
MDVVDSLSTAPGTDTVPSLDFDLITDGDSGNIWCEQCKIYKKNYEKLQEEHARSYNTLKKKIISTDLLIKKYKTKCEEYDQQARKLEDAVKRQEQLQRETDTLQVQLSSALHQIEPLKQDKVKLDQEVKRKLQEIQNLQDQVVAGESFKSQYEQLNKSLLEDKDKHEQELKDANKKVRELELSQQRQESQITKLKEDNKVLKRENGKSQKRERKTEESLAKAQETVNRYRQILIRHGLLPNQDKLLRITKGAGTGAPPEEMPQLEEEEWVDPASASDKEQYSDLDNPRMHCKVSMTKMKSETVCSEERKRKIEFQEEDNSLLEFPFTFSPLVSILSPLPPSPQSYRKEVEDNDESDDDLDEMAEQLEQEILNVSPTPRRSPRKRVPPSPLSRDPNTTVSTKEIRTKQVTIHSRRGRNVTGQDNDGPTQELRGIKRITFTAEESSNLEVLQGEVNSEVAHVNPKPILSGDHNSAFQKFSKSSHKQEKARERIEESLMSKNSGDSGFSRDSKLICDISKNVKENFTNIHHKRIECLKKHSFRPVSENHDDSDSLCSEDIRFTNKEKEDVHDGICEKGNKDMKFLSSKENIKQELDELTGKAAVDLDIESALSVRTLRKSLSLPESELSSSQVGAGSPQTQKRRHLSLSQNSPNKNSESCDSKLKAVQESPRRSQRNKNNDESEQKSSGSSELYQQKTVNEESSEKKFVPHKPPVRVTRSKTLLIPPSEIDTLCQRSRSRMRIPSGKKKKEGDSENVEMKVIKEERVEEEMERGNSASEDRVEEVESNGNVTRAVSRQESLGFALRSPPVLKSPPIVLPSEKGKHLTSNRLSFTSAGIETKEDADVKGSGDGLVVHPSGGHSEVNTSDSDTEKRTEASSHVTCDFSRITNDSKENVENTVNATLNEVSMVNVEADGVLNQGSSKEDIFNAELNVEDTELEGSLPRQGSMGFMVSSGDSGTDSGKSTPKQKGTEKCMIQAQDAESSEKSLKRNLKNIDKNSDTSTLEQNVQDSVNDIETAQLGGHSEEDMKEDSTVKNELFKQSTHDSRHSSKMNASQTSEKLSACLEDLDKQEDVACFSNSTSNSSDLSGADKYPTQTIKQCDSKTSESGNAQSTSSSASNSDRPPSLSEGGSSSPSLVYIPSLSVLVQKSTFSAVVASSTVVSPELENLPSHPRPDNTTTSQSPVSPLPPSPFHFFLPNPISPLPPSPVGEMAPISPLCTSPFDLDDQCLFEPSSNCEESVDHSLENPQVLKLKLSKLSTVKSSKLSSVKSSKLPSVSRKKIQAVATQSHVSIATKTSQCSQSREKIVQSSSAPRSFHAVAPPDAITVRPQKNKDTAQLSQNQEKPVSKAAAVRKRRSQDPSTVTPEEKKQCFENQTSTSKDFSALTDKSNLHKVIEAEMKLFLDRPDISEQAVMDKLVTLADHSTVFRQLLQWTVQYLRCQQMELFSTIHCYCAYSSDCQSRTNPFLTPGEVRLLKFYSFQFKNPDWIGQRHQLLDLLWTSIFGHDSLTLTGRLALCRMFVGLLHETGDMEHVRVFFYHVMTCKYLNAAMIAVTIAGVWPQCLYRNATGTSPVLVVMEAVIMKELQELKDKGAKISVCLKKLVNWDLCVHQNNVLLQHMIKEIEKKCADFHSNQGQIYELSRAVELLLVMQKVGFFKTVFIGVAVSSLSSKLRSKQIQAAEHYVKVIVQIAGSVLLQLTTMNEKNLSQIIRKYISKILLSDSVSQNLQVSVAQTLLELSFLSPVTVMSGSLYPWFLARKDVIPADFVCKLENTRQLLVSQFPFFRCPAFE